MQPQWAGNHARGRGTWPRGRGWRGHSLGPRGEGGGPQFHPIPIDYRMGHPMMRGHRGGYRGRPPPEHFNQQYAPHPNEPPWARLRGRPYGHGMAPEYPMGLHHRRPFLSPPRTPVSPVRPSSPLPGSEEYMQRDISEKSAFLKRQLLLEPPPPILNTTFDPDELDETKCDFASDSTTENFCDNLNNPYLQNSNLIIKSSDDVQNKCDLQTPSENASSFRRNKLSKRQKKPPDQVLSVVEIHDKIINHISNLSHGKKVNLVNQAGPSGYDIAVQQITRQKRQELSKALRDMCNNKFKQTENSSDVINAIIPDFDIKIEELPREVVEQLSSTLDENVEERIQTMCIDPEVMFQQAADMLNNMLDADSEVKDNGNLADCSTRLQDEFAGYSGFQNDVQSGDVGLDSNLSQNTGDPSTNFVPNVTQMQPGCTDLPYDETMTPTALNFPNDSIPCQSSSINFSVPPPMNYSIPPPITYGIPTPTCNQSNNELFAEYSNSQHDNNLNIPDDSYNNMTPTTEGCMLYPERNQDDTQYYSPGQSVSDENSLQATPVFNDLMMGQDLEQRELSLPSNVDEGGILLPRNPCDNPPFSLMEDQESEQYFDLIEEVDDGILMPPNEQPYNLIGGQDQLPGNLTEQIEQFLPPADEVDNILLPSSKGLIKEGKAIILSDIRIPPMKVSTRTSKVSDVLTEAAELEACLAQGEAELKMLDTSKSKKISFTFNKTNSFIRTKVMEDDCDDVLEIKSSSKKSQSLKKQQIETIQTEEAVKGEIKNEAMVEPVKVEDEGKIKEEPIVKCEEKVNVGKVIKIDDQALDVEKKVEAAKFSKLEQNKEKSDLNDIFLKEENKNVTKQKLPTEKYANTPENVKENEKLSDKLIPEEQPMEIEQTDKNKEKTNRNPLRKPKSKSKSREKEEPPIEKNNKKFSKKCNKKQKSFEEEEFMDKRKEKKSKSAEAEEYPKSENYKSKFDRSRYDIFYSQKFEDGYKKKYKDKSREMTEEDKHRRSDSDRSFEKYREKFRSSDSEHSAENRYSKYHQEREDTRHSKRYYHDCYPAYRTDYGDYKNDYYGSQKYGYAPEYYNSNKQESPYPPEDFEAKSSHHAQKHRTTKYEKKPHKKRSKKHKKQREKSNTSLSSISSEERDSSTSSLGRKTKQTSKYSDTEEKTTTKGHKIPLKDRIQMLSDSKFDRKRESSLSDYDENRKIKSEPISPEVSRKPSPERSKSVEKLQITREPLINADDLRDALNKKAEDKALLSKISHPGTPVVPFTNKPCPARKQVEDPLREREEMIMNRDSMISFRNKPCPLTKNPGIEKELEVTKEGELQLAKELPDIDSIAKIISNLSTIVTPTKDGTDETQKISKVSVKIIDSNDKTERPLDNIEVVEKSEPKKFVQRPWKSPGEKKFMMEHLQRNPAYEEELHYEADKKLHQKEIMGDCYGQDKFVVAEEEKLVYLNPEPMIIEDLSKKFMETDKKLLMVTNKHNEDCIIQNQNISAVKRRLDKDSTVKLLEDVKELKSLRETDEINSTSEKLNKSVPKIEKLKEVTSKPLQSPSELPKLTSSTSTKPVSAESTIESIKPQETKNLSKHKNSRNRSKSRSRSKTKERELLHSAEVSSTSDTAAKSTSKISIDSKSRSKSKIRNSTPQPPKEESKNESGHKLIESVNKIVDQTINNPEETLITDTKMLITTYTQTQTDDDKKEVHKSRKSSKKDKTHSSTSSSYKSRSRSNVSTQTSIMSTNIYTQTPSARCKSVQVQIEVEEEKPAPKKAIFVQTDPVVIFDNYDDDTDDYDDKFKNVDKSKRKILKAVRRRKAVERMFDLDKEIERLTKFRQSLYKKLNFDSESDGDDDEEEEEDTKITKIKSNKNKRRDLVANASKKKEKEHVNKKQKKNVEKQVNVDELKINVDTLKSCKKPLSVDIKKSSETSNKVSLKNSEVQEENGDKIALNVEKTATSIDNTVETKNKNIEKPKINKQEKIIVEKLKTNEQKHDLNKNLADPNLIKDKQKINHEKNELQQNPIEENPSADGDIVEKSNPPKVNTETAEKHENSITSKHSQIDITPPALPDNIQTVTDTTDIKNKQPQLEKLDKNQPETNESQIQPHKTTGTGKSTPIPSNTEKPNLPEPKISKDQPNIAPTKPAEEIIPEIKIERRTSIEQQQQPEKSDAPNSEAEDSSSVRSTRSKQKKPPEENIPSSKKRQRRKNESEERQTPTSDKRRHRKKNDSESKADTSLERDTSADEEAIQYKSKKRSRHSKSPKRSRDNKSVIKVKVKTTTEQKKRFQDNLKELKDVKNSQTKRRKRTVSESSVDEFKDELSKTIDEVARNEINLVNIESASTKLRKRDKAKQESSDHRSKSRNSKSLKNYKEFDEETEEKGNGPPTKQSGRYENQELTSDNLAFRGFTNESESIQGMEKRNPSSDQLSVVSEESIESLNKLNGNFNGNSKPQKKKKRKKTDIIELDPDIDSQNLLQIQMVKKPRNDFELYTDNTSPTQKKKKRYPFSGVKLNYRTKKRKSSDASIKSSSSVKRKEKKVKNPKLNPSIVRVTRYSLMQLEEMRKSIRGNKEENESAMVPTLEQAPILTDISEPPQLQSASDEPMEKKPAEAYNLQIVSIESLGFDVQQESKISVETIPVTQTCDMIEEEIHLKEEIPSVHSIDFTPENECGNSINPALHLETSNEAFEDFVKDSCLLEYNDPESEPPVLTPEIDLNEVKTTDCEYLEAVDAEDDDYKMDFEGFTGAILVIKVIASTAIAASDKGKVFCFSMMNGNLIDTFDMSKLAITSLIVIKRNDTNLVYTGSLDSSVGVLNLNTKEVLKLEKMPEPVQCMEYAWNYIFIGSDRGSLIRFDLNANKVEDVIKITDYNVLVIKATQEGPRKVLVVATRNAPVSIRDAKSGLLLRTMETPFSPTVYTLLFEKNLIYCGTSQHDILVYTFEDGQLIFKHEATKSKGVVCMQIVGNLLFAGCYNGNIYVYNTKTNIHLGTMNGPGGLMLSMEIVRNKIIVGTKSSNFRAWKIPEKYLDQNM